MYTDNFEEEILFTPARKDGEACNHLKIVTAFTDVERISSHLIKLFDGRNKEYVSGIKVDIILGMTKGTGLTQKKHDKICSLIKRLNSVSGMPQISCNYIVEGKQVHSKVYVWCRGRKAIEAFNGSANYTMNAFFVRRECMDACNPKEAKNYKKLPGSPDIVLTKYKIAIFCDGEFFHGKDWDTLKKRLEKSNNSEYWISKISRNKERDDEINKKLDFEGWTVIRFWGEDIKKHTDECVKVVEETIFDMVMYDSNDV